MKIELTKPQKRIYKLMKTGNKILLTGYKNTGKSMLLNIYKKWCIKNHFRIVNNKISLKNMSKGDIKLIDNHQQYFTKSRLENIKNCKGQIILITTFKNISGNETTLLKYFDNICYLRRIPFRI
jgi:hypothetical protein